MTRRKQGIVMGVLAGIFLVAVAGILAGDGWLMWLQAFLILLTAALFVREWRRESD